MSVSNATRLKELEIENTRLKKLLADLVVGKRGHPRSAPPKVVAAPARRVLVRSMTERGLSERRALADVAAADRSAHAIQRKLDRLDEAFLFERLIDIRDIRPACGASSRGTHACADR